MDTRFTDFGNPALDTLASHVAEKAITLFTINIEHAANGQRGLEELNEL
jgi:hypothetical protein